jgi:hypothetical protein
LNLSPHFTLEEFTRSEAATRKGLDNTPDADTLEVLRSTAIGLEEVRALLDAPIEVTSGYRSPKVNSAVGGSATSQHCKGEAVDFRAPQFGTPLEICREIMASDIVFDQLIYEGTWVHISFASQPRRSMLTAHFNGGRVTYTNGIS